MINATANTEVGIKITQVDDEEFCVEFTKKMGESLDFLNAFKNLQDYINGVSN